MNQSHTNCDASQYDSDVTSQNDVPNRDVKLFTAGELWKLQIPGLPTTYRRILSKAKREKWEHVKVPGKGPGGMESRFHPPPDVMRLVEARLSGKLAPTDHQQQRAKHVDTVMEAREDRASYAEHYRQWHQLVDDACARAEYTPPVLLRDMLIIALMHGMSESALDVMLGLLRAQFINDQQGRPP